MNILGFLGGFGVDLLLLGCLCLIFSVQVFAYIKISPRACCHTIQYKAL